MKSETMRRIAMALILLGIVIGAISVIRGHWINVATMIFLVLGQVLSLRTMNRREGAGRAP